MQTNGEKKREKLSVSAADFLKLQTDTKNVRKLREERVLELGGLKRENKHLVNNLFSPFFSNI